MTWPGLGVPELWLDGARVVSLSQSHAAVGPSPQKGETWLQPQTSLQRHSCGGVREINQGWGVREARKPRGQALSPPGRDGPGLHHCPGEEGAKPGVGGGVGRGAGRGG